MAMRRNLIQDCRGVAVVQMALIAPWALLLLLGIVELGLTLFTQSILDGAARDAARAVRTGQVQSAGNAQAQLAAFQQTLCSSLSVLLSQTACAKNVYVDLETFPSFSAVSFPGTCNQNGTVGNGNPCPFQQVNPRVIAGAQVRYNRQPLIPLIGKYLAGSNGTTTLVSTVVFQSEPFQ